MKLSDFINSTEMKVMVFDKLTRKCYWIQSGDKCDDRVVKKWGIDEFGAVWADVE